MLSTFASGIIERTALLVQITSDFSISGVVEFLDVHVERDNLLFIDPSAIRAAAISGDPYGRRASDELTNFFDFILDKVTSKKPHDHVIGEAALQHFGELGSTRLGMSRRGTKGHGAAGHLGSEIWTELARNPLCRLGIAKLKFIEDVPIFVDGIDRDITSDLTAKIIVSTLAQFTSDMMQKHSEFVTRRPTMVYATEAWSPISHRWEEVTVVLPVADEEPLLLVPKAFVNYRIEMSYGQYYGVALLDHIKWEETVTVKRGKKEEKRPRYFKKELRKMPQFAPSRSTNTKQTERILLEEDVDVLGQYRSDKQSSFVALNDDAIDHYLSIEP